MGTPSMSPMVTRMNRCSMEARVRSAYLVMSWEAMPYVTCLNLPRNFFRPFGSSSASRSAAACSMCSSVSSGIATSSHPVQVEVVLVGGRPLPEHPPLPGLDPGGHVGEQPERVVRREDGEPDHVAHGDGHEQRLQRGPGLHGVTGELVPAHPVQEVAQCSAETRSLHSPLPQQPYLSRFLPSPGP